MHTYTYHDSFRVGVKTLNELMYRNRKLEISKVPTKGNSREPAYSQALVQNKIDRQRVGSRVRQAGSRVTSCPGLPGTVPEWNKMSRVPARSIPGP